MRMPKVFRRLAQASKAFGLTWGQSGDHAYGLTRAIFPGARGEPRKRDTAGLVDAINMSPPIAGPLSKIAFQCASTSWFIEGRQVAGKFVRCEELRYAKGSEGRKVRRQLRKAKELKRIDQHPMLDLIRRPCPMFPGLSVRIIDFVYLDSVGESYYAIQRSETLRGPAGRGIPLELWPVPPSWVISTPTPSLPKWRVSFRGWQKDIPEQDMLQDKRLDPTNPYGRGHSLTRTLDDELDAHENSSKLLNYAAYNRGAPDAIVGLPGAPPEQVRQLEADWLQRNQGIGNFMRLYFTNSEPKIEKMGSDFAHVLLLVDLMKYDVDLVRQTFGIPPEILGNVEHSNKATIDTASYLFDRYVIVPRLEEKKEFYQDSLAPEFDDRIIINYETPVQDDKEYIHQVLKDFPHVATVDEVRDLVDMDPLPNGQGNVFVIQYNQNVVRELLDEEAASPTLPVEPVKAKGNPDRHAEYMEALFLPGEAKFRKAYHPVLEAMKTAQLKLLKDAQHVTTAKIISVSHWQNEAKKATAAAYRQIGKQARGQVLEELAEKGGRRRTAQKDDAESRGFEELLADLQGGAAINVKTVYDKLLTVFQEAIAEKVSVEELQARILDAFGIATGSGLDRTVETEVSKVVNQVRNLEFTQANLGMSEWLTAGDERVRDNHKVYGAAGPQPRGTNYAPLTGNDYTLRFPLDPQCAELGEIIRCRCVEVPA